MKYDGYQIVSEAVLISSKNTEYRVQDFLGGKTKFLFIVGGPGSGKTTLSSKEYSKYKILHLDDYFRNFLHQHKGKDQIIKAWKNLIEYLKNYKGQLVIEGIQVVWLFEDYSFHQSDKNGYDLARENSVIILNTSLLKAIVRRYTFSDFWMNLFKGYIMKHIKIWKSISKLCKKLKKELGIK